MGRDLILLRLMLQQKVQQDRFMLHLCCAVSR